MSGLCCADCGKAMRSRPGSLPQGRARCHECRRRNPVRRRGKIPPSKQGTCSLCGGAMHRGSTSLPQGVATCLPCRRSRRAEAARPLPIRPCETCGEMFEPTQKTHVYCHQECRPRGARVRGPHALPTHLRGYGHAHQKLRAQWVPLVATGEVDCALCQDPIEVDQKWDLDHTEDRTGYRGPAHSSCNRQEGAIRGNRGRRARRATSPEVAVTLGSASAA